MNTLKLFLFLILFILIFNLGYVLGTIDTKEKYDQVTKNNLNYCVFGESIVYAPRTHKLNLTGVKNGLYR